PARFRRRCVTGRLVVHVILGGTCSATTATPAPAPTWFRLFAVRHSSDSSWHGLVSRTYSPVVRCATVAGCVPTVSADTSGANATQSHAPLQHRHGWHQSIVESSSTCDSGHLRRRA